MYNEEEFVVVRKKEANVLDSFFSYVNGKVIEDNIVFEYKEKFFLWEKEI